MSEMIEKLSDDKMEEVAGGMTRELQAAYAVLAGQYGDGDARMDRLAAAGYNAYRVQILVNNLVKYEGVAKDVIAGKYGTNQARINNLRAAGYDAYAVQDLVNNMVLDYPM